MITRSLDQIIRQTETVGTTLIQKYEHSPLVLTNGHKVQLEFLMFMKSILPFDVSLSKTVKVNQARKPFTMNEYFFDDAEVHQVFEDSKLSYAQFLEQVKGKIGGDEAADNLFSVTQDAIKTMLTAYQAQFAEEIIASKTPDHQKCRAIYSVIVEYSSTGVPSVTEINFTPDFATEFADDKHLYNQAFKFLMLNEMDNVEVM